MECCAAEKARNRDMEKETNGQRPVCDFVKYVLFSSGSAGRDRLTCRASGDGPHKVSVNRNGVPTGESVHFRRRARGSILLYSSTI